MGCIVYATRTSVSECTVFLEIEKKEGYARERTRTPRASARIPGCEKVVCVMDDTHVHHRWCRLTKKVEDKQTYFT